MNNLRTIVTGLAATAVSAFIAGGFTWHYARYWARVAAGAAALVTQFFLWLAGVA